MGTRSGYDGACHDRHMVREFEDSLLSDDPLSELDDESLFGRDHFASRIIEVLGRVRQQSESSTIGLVGSWGSGKSTVLGSVTSRLEHPDEETTEVLGEKWRVATFNPWMFSGVEAMYAGFFVALRNALPEEDQWDDTKGKWLAVASRLVPAASLLSFFGGDLGEAAKTAIADAGDDIFETRDKVADALRAIQQPILLVLDDLDRLSAEELLLVFKLVRLVGRLPYVYYMLSYDEHTLVDLLSKTDLVDADDDRRALDYLEKIVQVRVDMPLLRPYEVDQVVERALTKIAARHNVVLASGERQVLLRLFDEVLSTRLRTPRAIKRMFGQVDAFFGSVGAEVNFSDYVVVTWLRTMEPGVYTLIQRHRKELLGPHLASLRQESAPTVTPELRRDDWLTRLKDAHVEASSADDILWLLGTLFHSAAAIYRSTALPAPGRPDPDPGRIQHPDYFDRFFAFGVPADDLPDATAVQALIDIDEGRRDSPAVARVEETFARIPQLVIRKFSHARSVMDLDGHRAVQWLAERCAGRALDDGTRERLQILASSFVADMTDINIRRLTTEVMSDDDGMLFMTAIHYVLDHSTFGTQAELDQQHHAAEVMQPLVEQKQIARLEELADITSSPFGLPEPVAGTVFYWRHTHSESLANLLMLTMAAQQWTTMEAMMFFVPVDGRGHTGTDIETWVFEDLFNTGALIQHFESEWQAAPDPRTLVSQPATDEIRRGYVLAALKKIATRPEWIE